MLRFSHRFHGHGSLRYVYKNGQAIRTHAITVKYSKNPRRSSPRFSVVVSKKVLKSAVGRNRIRRRTYEIIREELPGLKQNYDVVVLIFSSDIKTTSHDELKNQLRDIFTQANLYN